MRSLLEVMKSARMVEFRECRDGCLWYDLACVDDAGNQMEESLLFRIPLEDTAGASFPSYDRKCAYYQRWIRKELLLQVEEAAMIEQARKDQL